VPPPRQAAEALRETVFLAGEKMKGISADAVVMRASA
jgi:hypothetical protein